MLKVIESGKEEEHLELINFYQKLERQQKVLPLLAMRYWSETRMVFN